MPTSPIQAAGDLIFGTGEWRLESLGPGNTRVTYAIDVVANGWVAAILGRVLPFAQLHSRAMRDILAALEQEVARRTVQSGPQRS